MKQTIISLLAGAFCLVSASSAYTAAPIDSANFATCNESPGGSRTVRSNGFVKGLFVVSSNLPGATFSTNPNDANGLADRNIECAHFDDRTSGGTVIIPWRQFDRGPGAQGGRYNWDFVESQIQPWADRGQVVNLLVWPAVQKESQKFPSGQSATPQFILDEPGVSFKCPEGTAQGTGTNGQLPLPKFWEGRVKNPYRTALKELVRRYENDNRINYFRFGIGVGAESYPANGTTTPTNFCRDKFVSLFSGANDTEKANKAFTTWLNFTKETVRVFRNFDSNKPIVVTLNDFRTRSSQGVNKFANDTENEATRSLGGAPKLGLGVQGATTSDLDRWNASPRQRCNANWCKLFNDNKNAGIVLQVQTPTHSGVIGRPNENTNVPECASGNNNGVAGCMKTGNLVELMDFARNRGANSFELYPYEWYVVNDTALNFNASDGVSYRNAMDRAKN
ncbi:hypothetical protein PN836_000465 [Ningiella sp. W23]|uniref:hypothetical protein n=1 Tax=Ningiella sp. W23 TaxID=3023715 RepID=UPI003756BE4D